jgi:hypothetical protein
MKSPSSHPWLYFRCTRCSRLFRTRCIITECHACSQAAVQIWPELGVVLGETAGA